MNSTSIVFSEPFAKNHWLLNNNKEGSFKAYRYLNGLKSMTKVNHQYPFFVYEKFAIDPDLSKQFLRYFDYIDIKKTYEDDHIEFMRKVKCALIDAGMIDIRSVKENQSVIQLDGGFIPPFIKVHQQLSSLPVFQTPIDIYHADDAEEQVYAVFESVVKALEEGVAIAKIKIVNADPEDIYQLSKLFNDAGIPCQNTQAVSIRQYPLLKSIKDILIKEGLDEAKTYIMALGQEDKDLKEALVHFFNRYQDRLFDKHPSIFLRQMDAILIERKPLKDALCFIDIDHISNLSDHILIMNYVDERFPHMAIDNDYLLNSQKKIIHYPTSEAMNRYRLKQMSTLLMGLAHVKLFRPKMLIDQTRLAKVKLDRPLNHHDYHYQRSHTSYLKTDDLLSYAKLSQMAEDYQIIHGDYKLLKAHFKDDYALYSHQFTGIDGQDLNLLLDQKYSLTGTKIEKLKLCPFQYFMAYLLKMDDFKDNHYIYFGNHIHKALEMLIKDPNYDYEKAIDLSNDFPEDIAYKKSLFNSLLKENIAYIYDRVHAFHKDSAYKTILTEYGFSQKLNETDRFLVNGIIDKIMIDEKNGYFIIVDYKYSKKVFTLDAFKKGRKLQLPFYLLIFSQISDLKASGIFYRQTGTEKNKANEVKDDRLNGVFLDDLQQMKRLDPEGKHIQALRYTKTGMFNYSKKIDKKDFEDMMRDMKTVIYDAAKQIEAGDFKIEPIIYEQINNQSISCQYCNFAHVCYSKNKRLKEVEDDEVYTVSEDSH